MATLNPTHSFKSRYGKICRDPGIAIPIAERVSNKAYEMCISKFVWNCMYDFFGAEIGKLNGSLYHEIKYLRKYLCSITKNMENHCKITVITVLAENHSLHNFHDFLLSLDKCHVPHCSEVLILLRLLDYRYYYKF